MTSERKVQVLTPVLARAAHPRYSLFYKLYILGTSYLCFLLVNKLVRCVQNQHTPSAINVTECNTFTSARRMLSPEPPTPQAFTWAAAIQVSGTYESPLLISEGVQT